jgi:hypothetical protein
VCCPRNDEAAKSRRALLLPLPKGEGGVRAPPTPFDIRLVLEGVICKRLRSFIAIQTCGTYLIPHPNPLPKGEGISAHTPKGKAVFDANPRLFGAASEMRSRNVIASEAKQSQRITRSPWRWRASRSRKNGPRCFTIRLTHYTSERIELQDSMCSGAVLALRDGCLAGRES